MTPNRKPAPVQDLPLKPAGRGRPRLDPNVATTGMSMRLTLVQRAKVDRLGGAVFLRRCIDNAPDPHAPS